MGGGLALYIASSQPNLVKGIVVVDALPCLTALYNPDFQSKKIAPEEFNEFESQMRKIDEEQFSISSNGACHLTERLMPICIMSIPT